MFVWSGIDRPQRRQTSTEINPAQAAYLRDRRSDGLADARAWGFAHTVRRPRLLFERPRAERIV